MWSSIWGPCTLITLNASPVEHHQGVNIDQDVLPHHTKVTKLTKIPYHTMVYSNILGIRVTMGDQMCTKLSYIFCPITMDDSLQPQDSLKRLSNSCHS